MGLCEIHTMSVVQDRLPLEPGHYASIFISERPLDPPGYADTMSHILAEAERMDGYLGYESLRDGRDGIFISYWRDKSAIDAWRDHAGHRSAKARGVGEWYDAFRSVTCRVEETRWFRRQVSPR